MNDGVESPPAWVRRIIYWAFAILGLVQGALAAGFAAVAQPLPVWLLILNGVTGFLVSAPLIVAVLHVRPLPPIQPAPPADPTLVAEDSSGVV